MKKIIYLFAGAAILASAVFIVIHLTEPIRIQRQTEAAAELIREADELYQRQEYGRALERYTEIVDNLTKSDYVFRALKKTAAILRRFNRHEAEEKYLEKFIELFPVSVESAPYVYRLADIKFTLRGETDKAAEYFQLVAENFPGSEWGFKSAVKLAEIAHRTEKPEEAIRMCAEVIDKMESSSQRDYLILKNAQAAWQTGMRQEAWEWAKKIDDSPADVVKYDLVYNMIMARFEPGPDTFTSLAEAYMRRGMEERARQAYRRARRLE